MPTLRMLVVSLPLREQQDQARLCAHPQLVIAVAPVSASAIRPMLAAPSTQLDTLENVPGELTSSGRRCRAHTSKLRAPVTTSHHPCSPPACSPHSRKLPHVHVWRATSRSPPPCP